jgi:hypothetical protein
MIALTLIREQLRWPRVRLALDACITSARLVDFEDGSATPTNEEADRIASVLSYAGSPRQLFRCITSTGDGHRGATSTTGKQSGPQRITVGDAGLFALVDSADYEYVSCYRWRTASRKSATYASAWVPALKRTVFLHRLIMGEPKGLLVHHKNKSGLDCRRNNLVVLSHSEHRWTQSARANGSSPYKGVCRHRRKHDRPWVARIAINGRRWALGQYKSDVEAARVYNTALRKLAGTNVGVRYNETPGSRWAPIRASDKTLISLNDYALCLGRP